MRSKLILTLLLLVGLVLAPTLEAAKPNTWRTAEIYGKNVYSRDVSGFILCRVTGNVSGGTQFASSYLAGRGDDVFNLGWKAYALTGCANVTAGLVVDISDYVSSTGVFTVDDAGANWASGDQIIIMTDAFADGIEGTGQGGMFFTGTVTTATSTSVFAVADLISKGDDRFNEDYYVKIIRDAGGANVAPEFEIRDITDFVSATGTITTVAFSVAPGVGDLIGVIHRSMIKDDLPGALQYHGIVVLTGIDAIGALEDPNDSCYVLPLRGYGDDYFNYCGYWLKVVQTTDGAAPLGEKIAIVSYVSASGLFTFGVADGYALTAEMDAGDHVAIIDGSIANSDRSIMEGEPFVQLGTGSTTAHFASELVGLGDTPHGAAWLKGDNYYLEVLYSAGIANGETRQITGYSTSTGAITTDAFSAAVATNDVVRIVNNQQSSFGNMESAANTGEITDTGLLISYVKQLVDVGLAYKVIVDGSALVANTAFDDATFATFPNDWFSAQANWTVLVRSATQAGIVDEIRLITDFVSTGGVFTTADIGAAYTAADVIYIVPRSLFPEGTAIAGRLGDIATAAAAGAPTTADLLFAYIKQLINTLEGAVGIPTAFPGPTAPAADVSMAEVMHENYDNIVATEIAVGISQDSLDALIERQIIFRTVVDGGLVANTAFADADFGGFQDDYFSDPANWCVWVYSATQATIVGEVRLITDFTTTTGAFTTDDIGAAYTVGDVIYIVPRSFMPEGLSLAARFDATDAEIQINQDSLESASQVRIQSITFAVTVVDGDTVYFAEVTGGDVAVIRVEATVTTAGVDAQNVQLTTQGMSTGATETSLGADIDMDTPAVGAVVRWDLSNFGNAPVSTAIGVPVASGDIYEESCEIPVNTRIGFETGESPSVNCLMNVEIWYMTNGTGIIAAP